MEAIDNDWQKKVGLGFLIRLTNGSCWLWPTSNKLFAAQNATTRPHGITKG